MMLAVSLLAGAVLFRVRGGGLIVLGTSHGARAVYAAGFATLAVVVLSADWRLAAFLPALWLGACPAHEWGRLAGGDWIDAAEEIVMRALRGVVFTALAGAVLYAFDYPWRAALLFGLAGAAHPLAYAIAWRIPSRVRHLDRGGELGEALLGAWLGVALWLALV